MRTCCKGETFFENDSSYTVAGTENPFETDYFTVAGNEDPFENDYFTVAGTEDPFEND